MQKIPLTVTGAELLRAELQKLNDAFAAKGWNRFNAISRLIGQTC